MNSRQKKLPQIFETRFVLQQEKAQSLREEAEAQAQSIMQNKNV